MGIFRKESKDGKDSTDGKHVKDQVDSIQWRKHPDVILDPLGPVKYDAYEGILRSYLEALPQVAQRIDAIETHLESAEGKPFIRPAQRPEVGAGVVGGLAETVRLLDQRLAKLESKLS